MKVDEKNELKRTISQILRLREYIKKGFRRLIDSFALNISINFINITPFVFFIYRGLV